MSAASNPSTHADGRRPENLGIEFMCIRSISIYSTVTLPNKSLPPTLTAPCSRNGREPTWGPRIPFLSVSTKPLPGWLEARSPGRQKPSAGAPYCLEAPGSRSATLGPCR